MPSARAGGETLVWLGRARLVCPGLAVHRFLGYSAASCIHKCEQQFQCENFWVPGGL